MLHAQENGIFPLDIQYSEVNFSDHNDYLLTWPANEYNPKFYLGSKLILKSSPNSLILKNIPKYETPNIKVVLSNTKESLNYNLDLIENDKNFVNTSEKIVSKFYEWDRLENVDLFEFFNTSGISNFELLSFYQQFL